MSERRDLLVEIGTEELPPGALQTLGTALQDALVKELVSAELAAAGAAGQWFVTPRRLAVRIAEIAGRQDDRQEQRLGPAVAAAFDADGKAKPAAEGFARSCGVEVSALEQIDTDKGLRLGVIRQLEGQSLAELLPDMLTRCCAALPVPRPMRWSDREETFVRPVHWITVLHGAEPVPGELFGQLFGRQSRGHRFHHPAAVVLADAADYEAALEDAFVLVDSGQRVERIRQQAEALVDSASSVVIRKALLIEVANLCEWPVAVLGRFDPEFLQVPAEALRSSMEKHQRFFPVVDAAGELKPLFVAVANLASRDPQQVVAGFERVITPRLADAQFFWRQDLKTPLLEMRPRLDRVVYQKKLGSLGEKVARVAILAQELAQVLGCDAAAAASAAQLCKTDLVCQMVGEFPELQGTMGRHYALTQGHDPAICAAVEEHYLPRFAGDQLPPSPLGQVLALADRMDTLCGIFAVGMKPSGNRDPFALRRAALGIVRIIVEGQLDLDLEHWFARGFAGVAAKTDLPEDVQHLLLEFVMERMRAYYADNGIGGDVFEAVWARHPTRPLDFHQRVSALEDFRQLAAAGALAAANKRIGNLLRKAEVDGPLKVDPSLFQEPAERALYEALQATTATVKPMLAQRDYQATLEVLARLREPVDNYFDGVMVMVDEVDIRNSRLALLAGVKSTFDDVADISMLKVTS